MPALFQRASRPLGHIPCRRGQLETCPVFPAPGFSGKGGRSLLLWDKWCDCFWEKAHTLSDSPTGLMKPAQSSHRWRVRCLRSHLANSIISWSAHADGVVSSGSGLLLQISPRLIYPCLHWLKELSLLRVLPLHGFLGLFSIGENMKSPILQTSVVGPVCKLNNSHSFENHVYFSGKY